MRRNWWILAFLLGFYSGLFPTALARDHDQIIKERQAVVRAISETHKVLKTAYKEGNLTELAARANQLAVEFGELAKPRLFPRGSIGRSRAKEAIWANWSDFEQRAKTARQLALGIAAQAEAGNAIEAKSLAKSLAKEACVNCHQLYRKPKKKRAIKP